MFTSGEYPCQINPQGITEIAETIDKYNKELLSTLEESSSTMAKLRNTWKGEAADLTLGKYERFAADYFRTYYEEMNKYVVFLRDHVASGYSWAEEQAIDQADLVEKLKVGLGIK